MAHLTPKVSVVIPAYNAMTYLPEVVKSVLDQTFSNFEVIIVNDGSSDHTAQWVSELTDARIKLISQENQGVAVARNTGIAHSHGEYIAFLDADDIWEPKKLEKQVHCLDEEAEIGLVDTWAFIIDAEGNVLFPAGFSYSPGNVWRRLIEQNIVLCGSTAMVRRCCFEVGLFDSDLRGTEDWDMWTRIAACYSFKILEEPLVRYRMSSSSASKNFKAMEHNLIKAIEKIYKQVPLDLKWVKRRAYGYAYRNLASGAYTLASYQQAVRFYMQALFYYPQLYFSREVARPLLKSLIYAGLGQHGYASVRNAIQKVRSLSSIATFSRS